MDNYSGGQGDGRFSSHPFAGEHAGLFDPRGPNPDDPDDEATIPILHGNPYGPAVTGGQPNCQAGQTGYSLGEALLPGQDPHNPTFGVNTITSAAGVPPLGRTDLFLTQQGDRIFWDSENNPPLDP
jgi:hypothetical protein